MEAWRFTGPGRGLERCDVPEPVAGPGEVVVRVEAAGLCHSDLHIVRGDFPYQAPLTLGHEGAGVVEQVGAGVTSVSVDQRVAVYGGSGCGHCRVCVAGRDNLCEARDHVGLQVDGCFAPRVRCREAAVVPLPAELSFEAGAVAVDAVLTPYHALVAVGGLRPGERCAVFGLGGLGHNAVQIARHLGAWVAAVDPAPDKRAAAEAAGADVAVPDASTLVGSLDVAFDFVGVDASILGAQMALVTGGRMVLAGLGSLQASVLAVRFGAHEISMLGSFWGTRAELGACLELMREGRVVPRYETHPLATVNAQLDRLERGEVAGRVVLVP